MCALRQVARRALSPGLVARPRAATRLSEHGPSVVLLLVLAVAPLSVGAGPPYTTDVTGTQGRGNWQLELVGEYVRNRGSAILEGAPVNQERRVTTIGPVLTYGVAETVDVAVGLGRLRDRITENGVQVQDAEGTTDSAVEVK